jgi:hypothetical protein
MSDFPSRDEFANHLNTKFRVYFNPEQPTEVELTEVSELRQKPGFEAFSLIFLVPVEIGPLQGMFKTEHDALGTMDLFLVPVEQTQKGLLFEALFNFKISASNG